MCNGNRAIEMFKLLFDGHMVGKIFSGLRNGNMATEIFKWFSNGHMFYYIFSYCAMVI